MSKLTTLFNRVLVFVVFVLTGARLAVARIFPAPQSSQQPPTAKVFALTEAAWSQLRAGTDVASQDKGETKSGDDQKAGSKGDENNKGPSKSTDEKKEPSKSAECDKAGSKRADKNICVTPSDYEKKEGSKSSECQEGPGGGDGDTGGTGG